MELLGCTSFILRQVGRGKVAFREGEEGNGKTVNKKRNAPACLNHLSVLISRVVECRPLTWRTLQPADTRAACLGACAFSLLHGIRFSSYLLQWVMSSVVLVRVVSYFTLVSRLMRLQHNIQAHNISHKTEVGQPLGFVRKSIQPNFIHSFIIYKWKTLE